MRAYNRFVIDQEIECDISGQRDYVQLYDLSCGGCMIETRNPDAVRGAQITISLGDMGRFPGQIVWRIEKNAGVKFDHPLHQRVVEYFGYSSMAEEFDEADPRDRFGLPLIG